MGESEDVPKDFIKLKSEKLSVDEVSELVISPYCGAVTLFVGEFSVSEAGSLNVLIV